MSIQFISNGPHNFTASHTKLYTNDIHLHIGIYYKNVNETILWEAVPCMTVNGM